MKNTDIDYKFVSLEDENLATAFVRDGYVIRPVENFEALQSIQNLIVKTCAEYLTLSTVSDSEQFLNSIHTRISIDRLNHFRLYVFNQINETPWLRAAYYALAESLLHVLVGNELVMQRKINLSIQMPEDDSSLLPIHADVMDGDSPFEIVCWTPYVDCYDTKSMYILNPQKNSEAQSRMADFQGKGAGELTKELSDSIEYLCVPFGHVLLFNQTLLHGNVVNQENETRWSSNCRYKSVFSPYADKRIGEFFEPITLKPVTQIGMQFRLPSGFDE